MTLHVTTAADISMKELFESRIRRALLRKIMEILKNQFLVLVIANLVSQSLSFLLYIQDSLQYKQFLVPFINSSSRSEENFFKISQNQQEKISWSLIFHKDLRPGPLLKIIHSNTVLTCEVFEIFKNTFFI